MQWIADRFFNDGSGWFDVATALPVRLHVTAGARADRDIEWSDWCARLARIRHPLLHPLIDYGCASPIQRFEAYDATAGRGRAATHRETSECRRALASHGLTPDEPRARLLLRPVSAAGAEADRYVGIQLQPRSILDTIDEALEQELRVGPVTLCIEAPPGSGMRTTALLAARGARLRGFVPACMSLLAERPSLLDALLDRHLFVLDDGRAERGGARAVVTALARRSTRRHVIVRFERRPNGSRTGLSVDPFGVEDLVRMVLWIGGASPHRHELVAAARLADGLPGAFIAALSSTYARRSRAMLVHETPARYEVAREAAQEPPVIAGRVLGAALRATERAAALERAGRHGAAARILERGQRVLEGRQRNVDAAACALRLAVLALDRGQVEKAIRTFERAGTLASGTETGLRAAVGQGVSLTDAARLPDAEAALRGVVAATQLDGRTGVEAAAAAALGRCLFWQGRHAEAVAVLGPWRNSPHLPDRARVLTTLARCEAALGRIPSAVATAREAQQLAAAVDDPRVVVSIELALAEALIAAGDRAGARAALDRAARLARGAHLPLFRVRQALLHASLRGEGPQRYLVHLRRVKLPALLARRVDLARQDRPVQVEAVSELERLLDITQRSPDDRTALNRICKAVSDRLGAGTVAVITGDDRTLALEGRMWRSMSAGIRDVVSCGARVLPDRCREPLEAAEPVRYGGEVVAAFACRWPAGTTVDRDRAAAILRAAALSVAAPVRALLDASAPCDPQNGCGDLLGDSPAAVAVRESVARAARAPFPVLIEGESGSGKELVARGIHRLSSRRDRRFCALNCAALSDELVEAELFGHARGAFTGAAAERAGLFEEADGGTLFLDEVGELSARAQAKLLRVLQDGEVRRVGENLPRRVDARIVAATNRRLEDEVAAGRFRADLRFRLDVVRILVPPLRDRAADIPLLAAHFWREASARVGSQATLGPEALSALARYDWPGNVRELQNVIAWIAVHSPRRGRIGAAAIPAHVAGASSSPPCTFEAARAEFERRFIRAALAGANGRPARAAAALGVSRQGLAKMMRRLRIEAP